ncbi:MAG: ISKra4 family transposase [Oligoflexia bacterium]|nr:ISKra4 family transposase [Oligoflexia bacterium]
MSARADTTEPLFEPAFDALHHVVSRLRSAEVLRMAHDDVERLIEVEGRDVLRLLLQGYLDQRAQGEVDRAAPTGADGVTRKYGQSTQRSLATVLGTVQVSRRRFFAKGVKGGLHPLDAELNLPGESYSFGLRRRVVGEIIDVSFSVAVEKVSENTGTTIPKRQVEELGVRAAQDFDAFYAHQHEELAGKAESSEDDALVVLTSDGKGIVMNSDALRPGTRRKAEQDKHKLKTRLSPGEKRNRKRMAEVASVYELVVQARTVDDILAAEATPDAPLVEAPRRPKPHNKRVWASVDKPLKAVVAEAFEEALARDPWLKRTWVYLVDGNREQIKIARALAKSYGIEIVIVVDFIHVLEYLWKAAWAFFDKGDPKAEKWVRQRARRVLQGQASQVAAGMRRSATLRDIPASTRKAVDACADYLLNKYLLNKKSMLHYDEYLAKGMPIATGVIEGACRHLVANRMGITGARWGLKGAEAVLRLRALKSSGHLDAYWDFHRQRELQRNHLSRFADAEFPHLRRAA